MKKIQTQLKSKIFNNSIRGFSGTPFILVCSIKMMLAHFQTWNSQDGFTNSALLQ